jgi:hypothetical protein
MSSVDKERIFQRRSEGNFEMSSDDKVFGGPPNLTLLDKRRVWSFVEKLCLPQRKQRRCPQ